MGTVFLSKLKASFLHALVTLAVAALTAVLVFGVWFPGEFSEMLWGFKLYFIVLGVELVMGPVMSLVIFNSVKARNVLIRDYSIVGFLQLACLLYGLYVVSLSRPVFLVFAIDRIEVVVAAEFDESDLKNGAEGFTSLPWFGAKSVCINRPETVEEKNELLFSAVETGKDIQYFPKYYRECDEKEVYQQTLSSEQFYAVIDTKKTDVPNGVPEKDFTWLPVVTRFNVWTAIYTDKAENKPSYIPFDSFID